MTQAYLLNVQTGELIPVKSIVNDVVFRADSGETTDGDALGSIFTDSPHAVWDQVLIDGWIRIRLMGRGLIEFVSIWEVTLERVAETLSEMDLKGSSVLDFHQVATGEWLFGICAQELAHRFHEGTLHDLLEQVHMR